MRIEPDSPLGVRLQALDVTAQELSATRVLRWNLQLGAAITLPLSRSRVLVLAKGRYLRRLDGGPGEANRAVELLRHEL